MSKTKPEQTKKEAICVRMDAELKRLIDEDAKTGHRTPPAQIRLILKNHYGLDQPSE